MIEPEDPIDAMTRGYRDIPDNPKLRSLSYISLCELLASRQSGTTDYFVIEAEKRRRDLLPELIPLQDQTTNKAESNVNRAIKYVFRYLAKLCGTVVAKVVAALAVTLLVYALQKHGIISLPRL